MKCHRDCHCYVDATELSRQPEHKRKDYKKSDQFCGHVDDEGYAHECEMSCCENPCPGKDHRDLTPREPYGIAIRSRNKNLYHVITEWLKKHHISNHTLMMVAVVLFALIVLRMVTKPSMNGWFVTPVKDFRP